MATAQATESTLLLSERERDQLLLILEQALKEGRVERHRTEAFEAKKIVQAHVETLEGLIEKIRRLQV